MTTWWLGWEWTRQRARNWDERRERWSGIGRTDDPAGRLGSPVCFAGGAGWLGMGRVGVESEVSEMSEVHRVCIIFIPLV